MRELALQTVDYFRDLTVRARAGSRGAASRTVAIAARIIFALFHCVVPGNAASVDLLCEDACLRPVASFAIRPKVRPPKMETF